MSVPTTPPEGCPRGCTRWTHCNDQAVCAFVHGPTPRTHPMHGAVARERHGLGVCATGTCIEPCGPSGGCIR